MTKLDGVHPTLVAAIERLSEALELLGHPVVVTDGLRTTSDQARLYAKGRTTPGPIVTYADGVRHRSNHQAHADGFGRALDCAFLVDGKPSWAESHPWRLYGEAAKALGLRWGGDWTGGLVDRPHIEMPVTP